MDSIFAKIIKREIPTDIIYEDDFSLVIGDKFPSQPGQLLVISKRQVSYIFDLTDEEYQSLMATTKKVALALDEVYKTLRTCIVIEGFEVPHVHVRLYPCTEEKLILEPRLEASTVALADLAKAVKNKLEN